MSPGRLALIFTKPLPVLRQIWVTGPLAEPPVINISSRPSPSKSAHATELCSTPVMLKALILEKPLPVLRLHLGEGLELRGKAGDERIQPVVVVEITPGHRKPSGRLAETGIEVGEADAGIAPGISHLNQGHRNCRRAGCREVRRCHNRPRLPSRFPPE